MPLSSPVEVFPLNPVSCASTLWRMDGFLRVTIAVKATFGLVPEGPARMIAPEEIVARDRHHEGNPASSVEAAGELAPYLPKVGVILVGHAYAPAGQPAPSVSAHLSIFRERALLDKTVHVFGDRGGGSPAPFQRMPLRYERAFGGPSDAENPVGTGALPGSPLPNLIDPRDPLRRAGFGPIAASWPSRSGLLDAEARAHLGGRVQDLGAGFPFGYFQPAPPDQQLEALEGDEWLILDGLHPTLPRVRSRLPSARGLARATSGSGPLQPVELAADLLVIDSDRQICSVIWRGHLVVGEGEAALPWLRVYAGVEVAGRPLEWPTEAPARPAPSAAKPAPAPSAKPAPAERAEDNVTTMLSLADLMEQARAKSAVLPFAGGEPGPAEPRTAAPSIGTPWSTDAAPAPAVVENRNEETAIFAAPVLPASAPPAPALAPPAAVVAPPAPAYAPPSRSFEPDQDESGMTTMLSLAELEAQALRAVAPFAVAAPSEPSAPRPATLVGTPWAPAPAAAPLPITDDLTSTQGIRASALHARAAGAAQRSAPEAPDLPLPAPPLVPPKRGDKPAVPIINTTPLLAVTVPWQIRPPKDSLTIVVKGTFDLVADGPAVLRAEGEYPIGDVHLDDDAGKSLRYGSDLGIFKPQADVTLTGTAHAPKSAGGSTPAMQVAFHFGASGKGFVRRAAVLGERHWQKALLALAPTDPEPFSTMPLTWERAFGGPAFEPNPTGAGHKAHAGADGLSRLPNIEDPGHLIRSPGDAVAPVCFAPVAMLWKERWSKLGTYDRRWFKQRWPYFPDDFDWGFYQIAPRAQQLPYLSGDEPYSIVGMHAEVPRLDGRLPGLRVRCFLQATDEAGGEFREIPLVLDTAAFDVDAMKLCLVWRAFVEVSDEEAPEIEALFIAHEELRAPPMTLAEARAQYLRAATPAPPEETEPEGPTTAPREEPSGPSGAEQIAEARAEVEAQLAAAGIPKAAISDTPSDTPAPDPAAISASLREAGASPEEIAEVLDAMTPPPPDDEEIVLDQDLREKALAMLASGEPFDGLDFSLANLADLDFSGRSLQGTLLIGADLSRCSFASAKLAGATLTRATLREASFEGADLSLADLALVRAIEANFKGAQLVDTDFTGADLGKGCFDACEGESTQFVRARLAGAHFHGAHLREADFTAAEMEGASFDGALLPEVRLYDVVAHGASFRGVKMQGARVEGAKATKAMFINIEAEGSVWEGARLDEASFHGAMLAGASFARARCERAVFSTADLREARFRRAKLGFASFLRCNLMAATFERADLDHADLRGSNLHAAETWKAKLEHAKLDQAIVTGSKLA
jgi:uncharacterized protein YjbI with pentapeptide repeats